MATNTEPIRRHPLLTELQAVFEAREQTAALGLRVLRQPHAAPTSAAMPASDAAVAPAGYGGDRLRRAASRLLSVAGVLLIVAGLVLTLPAAIGRLSPDTVAVGNSTAATLTGFAVDLARSAQAAETDAPAPATPPAPPTVVELQRLGISAPVVVLGLEADGAMQSPDRPDVVAWYDFSGRPGAGSNAVFAGHLDFAKTGAAVFWRLKDARAGDDIALRLADGASLLYRVSEVLTFDAATAPIDQIVGATDGDSITLITCAGRFDRKAGQYDQRLVVRAVRAEVAAR